METKIKSKKKVQEIDKKSGKPKRISKTWEAFLKLEGTGKILDMRAVLK